jgi:hypothetical protein
MVETAGFVPHPWIRNFGCSPDGLVGEDGMIEIKCPETTTHLVWTLEEQIPLEHAAQMLAELSCHPERQWIDFVSFDPRLPQHLQLFIRRMHRVERLIENLEENVNHFNAEIEGLLAMLPQASNGQGPQPIVESLDHTDPDEWIV